MAPRTVRRAALLGSACALALAPSSIADPSGGVVVAGQAAISGQDTRSTVIDQASQRAIINWDDFSVAADGSVTFRQPNASSVTLNRVVGQDPSAILGRVTANGQLVLVNPNGVLFGQNARVDTAGLIATTHDIANQGFMAGGDLVFDRSSGSNGYVVNEGLITVAEAGLAAFVAPHVRNSGVISAKLGTVELGAATQFTVDFYGDDLISFPVGSELLSAPVGPDGAPASALVVNDGQLLAEGGSILMTASAARGVIDDVILANGEIAATSFASQGGSIVLSGGDAGDVVVAGALNASGATGGTVSISGARVLASGDVTADGAQAGGVVSVDGDWVSLGGALSADGRSGGQVDITAGGLSLAGSVSAAGTTGAGGAVDIDVEGSSLEFASATIDVSGASGGSIRNVAGHQITSSARYDASGSTGQGGDIDVSAGAVKLLSADIDASGASGGRVRLGGEFQGGAGLSADELPNATLLASSSGTRINVSAHRVGGAGGELIAWSDAQTHFQGFVDARPGAGGAGGFVEVSSGGSLAFAADIKTGGGQVLLDPKNLTIVPDSFDPLALILGYNYTPAPGGVASPLAAGDLFGWAVSLDGTRLAVGAPGHDLGGDSAGAVFLYSFADLAFSGPVLEGIIGDGYIGGKNVNVDLSVGDRFGTAVSLDGNRLAVGLPGFDVRRGAVHLFTFGDSVFTSGALTTSIGSTYAVTASLNAEDEFGTAVALDGLRLAVGAPNDDGHLNDFANFQNSGAVHLFTFTNSAFGGAAFAGSLGANYAPLGGVSRSFSNIEGGDRFGGSISLDGDMLVVSAKNDAGFNNSADGVLADNPAAVYLISFDDPLGFTGGVHEGTIGYGYVGAKDISVAQLTSSGELFGPSVSLSGSRLAVGAISSSLVNLFSFSGPQFTDGALDATVGVGGDVVPSGLLPFDGFGIGVSLDGDRLVVGAPGDDSPSDTVIEAGAAYLFTLEAAGPAFATFGANPGANSVITVSSLLALLNNGDDVTLQANNDITVATDIIVNNGAGNGGDLTLQAGRSIFLNASIFTDNGVFEAIANFGAGVVSAHRDVGDAVIELAAGELINTGSALTRLAINDGAGQANLGSGDITIDGEITADRIELYNRGPSAGSDVVLGANALLTAAAAGWATDIRAANGTFTNGAGPGGFAFTGGGRVGVWADHPDDVEEGVTGYAKLYNVGSEAAFATAAGAAGQNFFGYRTAPVITVNAIAGGKIYGDADPALGFNASGFIDGDDELTALIGALSRTGDENVGTYAIEQNTLAALLGYTINYTGANFSIAPKAITVSADVLSKIYGNADPTFTYSLAPGALEFSDTLSLFTGALGREAGENVASYDVTLGTLSAGSNYTLSVAGTDAFSITPKAITVTADLLSKIYGQADPTFSYTLAPGALEFSDTLGLFTGALGRETGENVASYDVTLGTLSAGPNYTLAVSGTDAFSITPKAITVSADVLSKIYGNADPSFTYTLAPGALEFSDTLSLFTGALDREAGENVASYDVTLGTLSAGPNYALSVAGANAFSITPRAITVTANAGQGKVYGAVDPALTYAITSGNLVGLDSLGGALSRVAGEDVGGYAILQGTLANANYAITYNGDTFAITPRGITVTVDAGQGKIYGAADPAFTYQITVGSLASGDSLAGALDRVSGEIVGTYAIQQGTLANANYTITFNGDTFAITPRALTVTADLLSKIYGNADPSLTYSVAPGDLVLGDTLSVFSGALARQAGENVASYDVTLGTLSAGPNYALSITGTDAFSITPRAITISANPGQGKTYGAADPALSYQITSGNLIGADALSGGLSRVAGENVGGYAIQQGTLAASANYALSYVGSTFTIDPATLTITANDATRMYGAADPTFTASFSGFQFADTASLVSGLTLGTTATAGSNVGSYAIIGSGATAGGNYTIVYAPGTLSVTQAPLLITANDATRLYGDANPAFSAAYSGFLLGDDASVLSGLVFATPATASSNVGQYSISASGAAAQNYAISYGADATLTVNPAPITVTVNNATKAQGEPNPAFTAAIGGLKLGQDASVISGLQFVTAADASSLAGAYAVGTTGGTAQNYVIVQRTDGTLVILQTSGQTQEIAQLQNDYQGGAAPADFGGLAGGENAGFDFAGAPGSTGEAGDADMSANLICVLADERECSTADGGAE